MKELLVLNSLPVNSHPLAQSTGAMKRRIAEVVDQPEFPLNIDSKLPHNLRRQVFEQIKQKIGGSTAKALEIEREFYSDCAPSAAAYKTKFLTWKNKPIVETIQVNRDILHSQLESLLLTEDQLIANNYVILKDLNETDPAALVALEVINSPIAPNELEAGEILEHSNDQIPSECPFVLSCDRCKAMLPSTSFCKHHPGKRIKRGNSYRSIIYNCCGAPLQSEPCSSARIHVYSPAKLPSNMLLERWSFFTLPPPQSSGDSGGIYAMDFEMVYIEDGTSALARVSIVDYWDEGKVVADFLVKPSVPIFDYNTRFSGITEESYLKDSYLSMDETRDWFIKNFTQQDIFIGHSLENDLIALRLSHRRVIDTSILFFDAPAGKKVSLERLTAKHVKAFIQDGISATSSGHDSLEDARACIHLVKAFLDGNCE